MISHEVAPSGIAYVTLGLDVSIIPYEDAVGMTTPRSYQVRTRIRGRYSVRAFLDEKAYGVTSLESYSTILEAVESDWKNLVIRLQDLRDSILKGNRGGMLLYITGSGDDGGTEQVNDEGDEEDGSQQLRRSLVF